MGLRHYLVVVIGLLIFAKGVWSIIGPSSLKRVAEACLNCPSKLHTLLGVLYVALGAALWIVVLIHQDAVDWILLTCGVLAILGGFMYFHHERMQDFVQAVLLNRENAFVRLLGIVMILVAAALCWIGVRGWGW